MLSVKRESGENPERYQSLCAPKSACLLTKVSHWETEKAKPADAKPKSFMRREVKRPALMLFRKWIFRRFILGIFYRNSVFYALVTGFKRAFYKGLFCACRIAEDYRNKLL